MNQIQAFVQVKRPYLDCTWDHVATSSNDPEKVIFNFSCDKLLSSDKDLLSKELRFAIPPKQIDYSNFMTEFELLYRSRFIYDN